jgi:hypothetical protein
MKHAAVDSDIFFFSAGQDKRDRNVRLASSPLESLEAFSFQENGRRARV